MSFLEDEKEWYFEVSSKIKDMFDKSSKDWIQNLKLFFERELPETRSKLPWLNETPLHKLRTDQLVRFRGMIQDMLNPELYMDILVIKGIDEKESKRPGRYMDTMYCSPSETIILDSPHCVMRDRSSYLCIPIPGENNWVKQIYKQSNPRSEITSSDDEACGSKRNFLEELETNLSCTSLYHNHEEIQQKRKKMKTENLNDAKFLEPDFQRFPLPNTNGLRCLLKTYEDYEISLNDVVEVIGVLSMDPINLECDTNNSCHDFMTASTSEIKEHALPTSLIPRLHVISFEKLIHCNPLFPMVVEQNSNFSHSLNIRELIGAIFDAAFLGDELAAEYFICHLMSSVHIRQDIIPVGKFSINLSGISQDLQEKNYMKLLYTLIENLTTHSHYFPMTIENMNNMQFVPKKDYETNSLQSGMLQLPRNFHLVIDETQLTSGKLENQGIVNLAALKTLIDWQKVDYEFQFHKIEQHTDVPVLILSEGKSMLNCDFQIKLDPKHTNVSASFAQVEALLTDELLENIRKHLTLGRLSSYKLEEHMQKMVQEDFVASRRHEGGMTDQDLFKLLSLARFLAHSCGKENLDEDIWKSAKLLESERKGRLINS